MHLSLFLFFFLLLLTTKLSKPDGSFGVLLMWFLVAKQNHQRQFDLYVPCQRDLKGDLKHKKQVAIVWGLVVKIFMGSFSVYACEGITSRAYLTAVLTENAQNESRCNLTPLRNSCRQTWQPVPPVHGHCVSLLSVIIFRLKRKWGNRPWLCTPASSDSSWKRWESSLEGYSGLWWWSGWSALEQGHLSGTGRFLCAPSALTEQQRSVSHTDKIWVLLCVQSHSPLPKRHPMLPLWEIKRNLSNL